MARKFRAVFSKRVATRRNCLSFEKTAFDQMTLGVEMLVERIFDCARRIIGDDGGRPFGGDGLAQVIGVIGGVGHDDISGQSLNQGGGLRRVALLACGQGNPHGTAQAANGHMDLGAQAAARAADRLIFRPPFLAPAAC